MKQKGKDNWSPKPEDKIFFNLILRYQTSNNTYQTNMISANHILGIKMP